MLKTELVGDFPYCQITECQHFLCFFDKLIVNVLLRILAGQCAENIAQVAGRNM